MLVKLPKEVGRILNVLQENGFEAYIVGECIADSLAGRKPFGWDISTNARLNDTKKMFPEAEVYSEKFQILRFEYIEEIKNKDGQVEGEEGIIIDLSPYRTAAKYEQGRLVSADFASTINKDLAGRDFTINAIAENQNTIVDPYDGRGDMRKKLLKTVGEASDRFREDPVRMLKAVRLAAQMDFDLSKPVYEAILKNSNLLESARPERIRDEFTAILSAPYAAKGLSMLLDTGLIAEIVGRQVMDRLSKREMQDLTILSRNIDRTQPVEDRRLALFFTCIDKKKIRPAIDRLNFNEVTHQHLVDAINDMPKLYFTATKPALKKFIYQRGMERYEFLLSMEKAQRIVFEYDSETKIRSKIFMLEQIQLFGEPIFPEELKIDANDLIEAGICTAENADKMLNMLVEEIHMHPRKNTREDLLKLARIYSKNKLAAALRGIHWSR